MSFDLHHPTETTLGTGVAVAITVSGLAILLGGFAPDGDDVLQARGQRLASTLDRLGFAHAFAYGEVLQAASDAVVVSATGRPEREPEVSPDGDPSSPPQPAAF